jgi:sulfur carrier protein ThiS
MAMLANRVMEIQTRLMGVFKAKSPAGQRLELADGATIADALRTLEIPADHVHLVMINNRLEHDHARVLQSGDELMVMPPVGGG